MSSPAIKCPKCREQAVPIATPVFDPIECAVCWHIFSGHFNKVLTCGHTVCTDCFNAIHQVAKEALPPPSVQTSLLHVIPPRVQTSSPHVLPPREQISSLHVLPPREQISSPHVIPPREQTFPPWVHTYPPPPLPREVSATEAPQLPHPPSSTFTGWENSRTECPHLPFYFDRSHVIWAFHAYSFSDWSLIDLNTNKPWLGYEPPPPPPGAGPVQWVRNSRRWSARSA